MTKGLISVIVHPTNAVIDAVISPDVQKLIQTGSFITPYIVHVYEAGKRYGEDLLNQEPQVQVPHHKILVRLGPLHQDTEPIEQMSHQQHDMGGEDHQSEDEGAAHVKKRVLSFKLVKLEEIIQGA